MALRSPAHRAHAVRAFLRTSIRSRPRLWALGGVVVMALLALVAPFPRSLMQPGSQTAVQITDRGGRPLYEVRDVQSGSYAYLPLQDMPRPIIDAFLSVEDRDFYLHNGFSPFAIVRAAWQNITAGYVVSGGSTITQQLVRLRMHPQTRSVPYKMLEALLAWKLELYRGKDEILESYLNSAYFGRQAYGVAAAARTFFNVSPQELSLGQSALLAGLVQSPVTLDPFAHPDAAKERQKRVLQAMRDNGVISEEEHSDALREPLQYARGTVPMRAPHFVQWLRQVRPEAFATSGTLETTLDLPLQQEAERIVERKLAELKDQRVTSAAVVVLDAHTGDIRAMVGSADYFDSEHDGAVNVAISPRQPGSALKPFTYALALQNGDTAATTVADIETQFYTQDGNPYVPRNYDYGYHGLVRYREALANSYNIAAVRVLEKVGVAALQHFLTAAGISTLTESPEHYGLALTLGDAEVTLLDLTSAYGMFARGGEALTPRVLPSDPVMRGQKLLSPQIAWLISDILSDADARLPEFGENTPLSFSFPVAAKTGTTRNSRDNWTVGYTPDVVVGVWVGNADNTPMRGTSGITGAGPIFHDVMLAAAGANHPAFARPAGLVSAVICRLSGKLPTALCPHTMEEWFVEGTQPTEHDDIFRAVRIDRRNGLLATDACPVDAVEQRTFAVFPKELTTWARENGWQSPPEQASPLCGGSANGAVQGERWFAITDPEQGDSFRLDPLIPDSDEHVVFRGQGAGVASVDWYVDGVRVGTGNSPAFRFDWQPRVGTFTVEARAEGIAEKRQIEVIR